jgi:ribosome-associated toxin RatA of RatAB toxin-antitoxin module
MEINKESKEIPYSSEKIYTYIIDINNYENILKNEIKSFDKISENEFKIKIGSMPGIKLILEKNLTDQYVKLISNDTTFNFSIIIYVNQISEKSSKVTVKFIGSFSSMIEMMIRKPLENFIESLKNKIEEISL